jgi:hypothetical protein
VRAGVASELGDDRAAGWRWIIRAVCRMVSDGLGIDRIQIAGWDAKRQSGFAPDALADQRLERRK